MIKKASTAYRISCYHYIVFNIFDTTSRFYKMRQKFL